MNFRIVIEKRTVLILGAGASAVFAFPLGRSLLLQVVEAIKRRDETHFYRVLRECGFEDNKLQDFARDLAISMQPSVDAFLESRTEFLDVGKAAIAAALLPYEGEDSLQRHEPMHWYEYLFNRIGPTRADYERSRLSIITFNYDRSFEHFLFLALRASFGLPDGDCRSLLERVPLVHVYGQLGALDYISPGGRRYHPDLNPQTVLKCASGIKIVHEGQPDSPEFKQAQTWLGKAEVVCFLGFGYHKSNVERLRFDQVSEGVRVYGSVYNMMGSEVDAIRPLFEKHRGRLQFGNHGQDVLLFLRNNPVFL